MFEVAALALAAKKTLGRGPTDDDWLDHPEFNRYAFKRGWGDLFAQSCDQFEVLLMEALWRADCQRPNYLLNMLADQEDFYTVLPLCKSMQKEDKTDVELSEQSYEDMEEVAE